MTREGRLSVLLVDPSLFTAPYDAALAEGLRAAGVRPRWAIRPTRPGDREEIPASDVALFFYRSVDRLTRWPARLRALAKACAHASGLARLIGLVRATRPDVVHFQWLVVPPLDALAMWILRRWCPVVLTVHDTTPFNGDNAAAWRTWLFDLAMRRADRLIVHTNGARSALVGRGLPSEKLALIAHGPLRLHAEPSPRSRLERDPRWTFVVFGELKPYKGIDVLLEALALLPDVVLEQARVVVAGRPQMDLAPIFARIAELGLDDMVELCAHRLSEQEMADLFGAADCFVFPYRQVDASGVYFLVKGYAKWIIASRVGIFAEDLIEGRQGKLVPAEDALALAEALARAVADRPRPEPAAAGAAWTAIGEATGEVYIGALTEKQWAPARAARRVPPWMHEAPPSRTPQLRRRAFSTLAALALATLLASLALTLTWLSSGLAAKSDAAPPSLPPLQPEADGPPRAPLGVPEAHGYRLLHDWDFRRRIRDEASLRALFHTRYIYDGGKQDHLNDEWSRYRDHDNHVFTPEGLALVAQAKGEPRRGHVESGMLRSRWSGQYGVFEIRTKVPAGRGLWPAFWLNPEDGIWPPEIDVLEVVDNGRDTTRRSFHFLHGVGAPKQNPPASRLNGDHAYEPGLDYAGGFHVFAVEWTPERVRHIVDGVTVVDRAFRWLHDDGKDAGPAHVLVNLAVGGNWPGPPEPRSLPARLLIEYIRVWQR
jgi:glycosyltransferase involved in cell wall biosynthesis